MSTEPSQDDEQLEDLVIDILASSAGYAGLFWKIKLGSPSRPAIIGAEDYQEMRKIIDTALQALKAREEAIAVRARLEEVQRLPHAENFKKGISGNDAVIAIEVYRQVRTYELTQLQSETPENKNGR